MPHFSLSDNVVLSLDYDGCACVLFKEGAEECGQYTTFFQKNPLRKNIVKAIREAYELYLTQITEKAKRVELYVGSNRQDQITNQFNMTQNRNGDCFVNYQQLADRQGWTFQPLLLADHYKKVIFAPTSLSQPRVPALEAGSAMKDKSISGPFDKTKIGIILGQLKEIAKDRPNVPTDFYFIDDDYEDKIIPALKQHFLTHPKDIPAGVTIHLVKFDWFDCLNKYSDNPPTDEATCTKVREDAFSLITEKAVLKGAELPLSTELDFSSLLGHSLFSRPWGLPFVGLSTHTHFFSSRQTQAGFPGTEESSTRVEMREEEDFETSSICSLD